MEKSCGGGRRGGGLGNGASAPRRLRTQYKDFSGFDSAQSNVCVATGDEDELMEGEHNVRHMERMKDTPSVLSLQGSTKGGSSRNKRKRNGYQETAMQARGRFTDDMDETTESTEAGASDDDDDLPPPAIPLRAVNSRPQGKFQEDGVLVDLFIVPRKARTAIMKRPQESPLRGIEVIAGRTSAATVQASTLPLLSSTVSSKFGKKAKLTASKLRSEKVPKVCNSPVISEQEVEAAEALSDLSRMFVNPVSPKAVLDVKVELQSTSVAGISNAPLASSSLPLKPPASASSPDLSYSSAGASSQQAEGTAYSPLKRKRPRVKLSAENGDPFVEGRSNAIAAFAAVKVELDQTRQVPIPSQSCPELDSTVAASSEAVTALSPNARASSSIVSFPVNLDSLSPAPVSQHNAVEKGFSISNNKGRDVDTDVSCSTQKNLKLTVLPEKFSIGDAASPAFSMKEMKVSKSSLCAAASLAEQEVSRRSPPVQEVSPAKWGIDLMASPPEGSERTIEHFGAAVRESGNSSGLEKETVATTVRGDYKEEESAIQQVREVVMEQNMLKQKYKEEQKGRELAESNNQHTQKLGRHVKADVKGAQKQSERAGASYQSSAATSTSSLDKGTRDQPLLPSLPSSVNVPGWPGVLPTLGYYGPVAAAAAASVAAWPGVASLAKASMDENNSNFQLPSYVIPPRQPWKRCASHVYIARFIGVQQQMAGHPFFAATYANPTGLYGAKPYLPLPPTDALYGAAAAAFINRKAPGASSSANMLLSADEGSSYGVGSLYDKDIRGAFLGTLTTPEAKERVSASCTDALFRISLLQQPQLEEHHQSSTPLQVSPSAGSVSAAGPLTFVGTTGGLGMLSGTSGMPGLNSTTTGDSEVLVSRGGSITTIGTGVSIASAQAQYIQAIMQQNTFPFIFPPHFGSPSFTSASVHVGQQQPPQFFNSPYFHSQTPIQAQQQTQQTPIVSVGLVSQQKQQDLRTFSSTGSSVQQQQQPVPPRSSQQQQQQHSSQTSPQQVQGQRAEESNAIGANVSAESKFSIMQRALYGHTPSSGQISSSVNLSSPISTVEMQMAPVHQDFGSVAVSGMKQNCQNQQQKQLAPMQQQSQQLSGLSSHLLSSPQMQMSGGSPGFSLGLKGLDSQISQAFHSMSVTNLTRGSVGPGPLGLAPVAAVMAPEGHAVLPNMVDPTKNHTQYQQSQLHQSYHPKHSNLTVQQQQRCVSVQRSDTGGTDDVRSGMDSNNQNGANRGRDSGDERKSLVKRALGSSSLPTVDFEAQPDAAYSSSINPPLSRPLNNGSLVLTAACTLPSHPSGQMLSVSLPAPNVSTNLTSKQTAPRDKALLNQNVIASPTSSLLPIGDRASLAVTFKKSNPLGLCFPSGQISTSNCQRQGQPLQHAQVKSMQRPSQGSLPAASENSQALPLAAGKSHMQQSRSPPVTGASLAPCLPSPTSVPSSGSMPSPPLPPILKSPSNGSPKIVGTGKSSSHVAQKASTAAGKRSANAASIGGTTPSLQSVPSKPSQLQTQQAQQLQPSQLQQSILPASFQLSPLAQQFQQQQSHLSQQQVQQSQKQSLQQQQQVFLQQQQQHYLQQQHHKLQSQPQMNIKNQQNQAVLQPQQQHSGVQPSSQNRQSSSFSKMLQHLQQQKHQQFGRPLALSNPTGTSSTSPNTLMMGSSNNPYPGNLNDNLVSDENGSNRGPGSRQNPSGSHGITGAYLQAGTNSGAIGKKLEQAAGVDGLRQEHANGNLSVASSSPCNSPTTGSPTFDTPAARITSSVMPIKSAAGQISGVNHTENAASGVATASIRTSLTVTATINSTRTSSLSNDGRTKKLGHYHSDSSLGSNGRVSIGGTSASLHQGAVSSVQPNNTSTHQVSTSATPGTFLNVSSNAQAG
ncbi:hypothetical protein O6H91_04G025100 [Diphasiastrum complanatum]|uniref:Uncharacterized protein n=1 Tax=Diphasiastrum complanatum TaxID=34168 RepID=A0ACC2DV49_DIPCM|nr:hypothetical protein O6H91_04G025100 [Diphasiastrum complanatum]